MNWTDNRQKKLTKLWRAGQPASVIARMIGGGCTKNMVIGKARRLDLPERDRSAAMAGWWAAVGKRKWKSRGRAAA